MTKIWVFSFGSFLELAWHLQTTRSRRLVNRSWWFLVQNEVESLLVLFLLFPTQFCWVESNENFQWSKKLCFFLDQTPKMEANVLVNPLEKPPRISGNNEYTAILHPGKSKALLGVVAHQFSGQTEHLAMGSSGASISASWTRNEPTYRGGWWFLGCEYPKGVHRTVCDSAHKSSEWLSQYVKSLQNPGLPLVRSARCYWQVASSSSRGYWGWNQNWPQARWGSKTFLV